MTVLLNTEKTESTEREKLRERWANDVLKHYLMNGYFASQGTAEPEQTVAK